MCVVCASGVGVMCICGEVVDRSWIERPRGLIDS